MEPGSDPTGRAGEAVEAEAFTPDPPANPPDESAQDLRTASSLDRMEGYFPNFELVTHEGERVRFYDDLIRDRVVIVNFMYTTCDGI